MPLIATTRTRSRSPAHILTARLSLSAGLTCCGCCSKCSQHSLPLSLLLPCKVSSCTPGTVCLLTACRHTLCSRPAAAHLRGQRLHPESQCTAGASTDSPAQQMPHTACCGMDRALQAAPAPQLHGKLHEVVARHSKRGCFSERCPLPALGQVSVQPLPACSQPVLVTGAAGTIWAEHEVAVASPATAGAQVQGCRAHQLGVGWYWLSSGPGRRRCAVAGWSAPGLACSGRPHAGSLQLRAASEPGMCTALLAAATAPPLTLRRGAQQLARPRRWIEEPATSAASQQQ